MLTGGFKSAAQAIAAIQEGAGVMMGLARAFVIDPALPQTWRAGKTQLPFPRFAHPPEGGITAWYTQQLIRLGQDLMPDPDANLDDALFAYNLRDTERTLLWNARFGNEP